MKFKEHQEIKAEQNSLTIPTLENVTTKDILQIIAGASILAVPVGFTEETWMLGEILPKLNILLIFLLSLSVISLYVYYHYHHKVISTEHKEVFIKRVFFTYILSFFIVAILLTLIEKAEWNINSFLALKRTIIVTLPASVSAVVVDTIK